MNLNDIQYFYQVVQHGSFTQAAVALGVNKSLLSRRVANLEQRLQIKLLYRSTRALSLTPPGHTYYQHCKQIMQELQAAQLSLYQVREKPFGRIVVSCPALFAQFHFGQYLIEFMQAFPEVQLHLVATERLTDLHQEGIDLALRFQSQPFVDSSLVVRDLGTSELILVASPQYLQQHAPISVLQDLANAKVLFKTRQDGLLQWRFKHQHAQQEQTMTLDPLLQSNEWLILKRGVMAGLGVAVMPQKYCQTELNSGELVRVLPDWSVPTATLYLIYPTKRYMIPSVRCFIDFMIARL